MSCAGLGSLICVLVGALPWTYPVGRLVASRDRGELEHGIDVRFRQTLILDALYSQFVFCDCFVAPASPIPYLTPPRPLSADLVA